MFDILTIGLILLVIIVIVAIVLMYNGLVTLVKRADNAWSQIDVQLKRRVDLIPNLIETVKGYARFEKSVLTEVTKARTSVMAAQNVKETAKANDMLSGALKTLFAVAESYPALRANENFLKLQEEFATTENKIAYARQFYNDTAMELNTATAQIPSAWVAALFNVKGRDYFQLEESEKKPVKADFSDLK